MEFLDLIRTPLIVFMVVVAPIWIIAHYMTRWRTAKTLTAEDEKLLADLWKSAESMDQRIRVLERILDAEVADWRSRL